VASGRGGDASGEFINPFSQVELENFVLKVGRRRQGVRRIESAETMLAREFGTKLFDAVFADDRVRDVYKASAHQARSDEQPMRVTLAMTDAPDLCQLPWEYLYDHPDYLAISRWTPIVRYLDLPKARQPLRVSLPIRILAIVSAPSDAQPIDADSERTKLLTALGPLTGVNGVTVDWLSQPSLLALNHQLRKTDYHVLHYIGHGGYDPTAKGGALFFEDGDGRAKPISGEQLGNILRDEISLRLVVLNSCEGGRSSVDDPFSGVATSLVERGIPAVIGMQFEISDRAAIVFASEFYTALANGMAVDTAVAEARRGIYADDNHIEWGTPVLFMRVQDGNLFDVAAHERIAPAPRDALFETAAHRGLNVAADEPAGPPRAAEAGEPAVPDAPVPTSTAETGVPPASPEVPTRSPLPEPASRRSPSSIGRMPIWARVLVAAAVAAAIVIGFMLNGPLDEANGRASVPNVYGMSLAEADNAIRALGFTNIRTEDVCSGRLGDLPGVVREVLIDTNAPAGQVSRDGDRLVGDAGEALRSELALDLGAPLLIKVSIGPCP
jgi:hypothetical protein